ncbi:metalloprotease TldD [Halorhodospira halophila]|uniref:Microcin-processing peptidase 2 n=1 Tax=Halorhodospira halophila (strain DSM 244 / SL1) TaxID=349124 RepID=A1WYY6_HALHL|nr:metalloprotease TldD [Halorhodospira halophila]ABM62898.1 microcin-processing peptidase 2, Unknown type peptidase, MEROPS family U62 [Halorhodospira halophila SL1]MBK1727979.1 metalloprotease TldD [Halorhodospira halophila]
MKNHAEAATATRDPLHHAEAQLLAPAALDEARLGQVFSRLLRPGVDFADLYFQAARREAWVLEDGIVREGSYSIDRGVGVRAVSGEKTGFAYCDEIGLEALLDASSAAGAVARSGQSRSLAAFRAGGGRGLYRGDDPLASLSADDKVALLHRAEAAARAVDPRIVHVVASLAGAHDTILVANSEGGWAGDIRPLVRLNVSVLAASGERRESGSSGGGGRYDYQQFVEPERVEAYAREAARQALVNLEAEEAPAGHLPVVLGPGWPGVLLHEAVGHGLEGDFNRKGTSAFSGRIGERVASPLCTVVDDGTIAQRRGSLNIDDEGHPSQCNTLIEDGVLTGYMQDRQNAGLMGMARTGNARRESYAHLPMPRMTNTYMLAGPHDPEEIIASVDQGLYAVNFGGGQVDITSGKFVFSASEAYWIENGRIQHPVKGATLIGNGPDVLTRVSMVGNDLALDGGIGVCGKEGQSVPVGVGQPTLKVDGMTVGGTQA